LLGRLELARPASHHLSVPELPKPCAKGWELPHGGGVWGEMEFEI